MEYTLIRTGQFNNKRGLLIRGYTLIYTYNIHFQVCIRSVWLLDGSVIICKEWWKIFSYDAIFITPLSLTQRLCSRLKHLRKIYYLWYNQGLNSRVSCCRIFITGKYERGVFPVHYLPSYKNLSRKLNSNTAFWERARWKPKRVSAGLNFEQKQAYPCTVFKFNQVLWNNKLTVEYMPCAPPQVTITKLRNSDRAHGLRLGWTYGMPPRLIDGIVALKVWFVNSAGKEILMIKN